MTFISLLSIQYDKQNKHKWSLRNFLMINNTCHISALMFISRYLLHLICKTWNKARREETYNYFKQYNIHQFHHFESQENLMWWLKAGKMYLIWEVLDISIRSSIVQFSIVIRYPPIKLLPQNPLVKKMTPDPKNLGSFL